MILATIFDKRGQTDFPAKVVIRAYVSKSSRFAWPVLAENCLPYAIRAYSQTWAGGPSLVENTGLNQKFFTQTPEYFWLRLINRIGILVFLYV